MRLYLGNKKVAPVVYIGSKTLTVINKSSSAVKKGDNVWINESPDYSYNFYSIGSPTFDKNTGIVSGFSANDYIRLEKPFNPKNNTWEIKLKFTTGNDVSIKQRIFHSCKGAGETNRFGLCFSLYQGHFNIFGSSDGSSWLFDLVGSYAFLPNTTYYVILSFDGSKYSLKYSFDNIDYIEDAFHKSSSPIYSSLSYSYLGVYSGESLREPFLGSIDLSETYIKINDEIWWTPITKLPKEYYIVDGKDVTSSSLMGVASEDIAVGTKVANVENGGTEVDGIMSTYVANETKSDSIIVYKDKSFEGVFKLKASEWSKNDNHFIQTEPNFFYVRGGSGYLWSVFKTASSEDYTKTSFSNTGWIYFKVAYTSNMISWSYSLDGKKYTSLKIKTGENSGFISGLSSFVFNLYFGCKFGGTGYETWNGQIDFNESYFKVDGETVWSGIKYINGGSGLVKIKTISEVIEKEIQKEKYGATANTFLGDVDENGVLQQPTGAFDLKFTGVKKIDTDKMFYYAFYKKPSVVGVDFDTVEYIGNYSFYYAFSECPNITTVAFPKLTSVDSYGLYYTFNKSGVTSASFPMLETVGEGGLGYIFRESKLTSITFPVLKTVGKNALIYALSADNLTSASFPMLESVGYQGLMNALYAADITGTLSFPSLTTVDERGLNGAFGDNYNMTSVLFPVLRTAGKLAFSSAFHMTNSGSTLSTVEFPVLETIGENCFNSTFYNCSKMTSISFPSLTSVQANSFGASTYNYAFQKCSKLTEIHFRSDMQETISSMSGYADKWGATNATIYFDL